VAALLTSVAELLLLNRNGQSTFHFKRVDCFYVASETPRNDPAGLQAGRKLGLLALKSLPGREAERSMFAAANRERPERRDPCAGRREGCSTIRL